jgi:hypothetical protein
MKCQRMMKCTTVELIWEAAMSNVKVSVLLHTGIIHILTVLLYPVTYTTQIQCACTPVQLANYWRVAIERYRLPLPPVL